MLAAQLPVQRPADAKLLVVDAQRNLIHVPRSAFVDFLHANDLVIAFRRQVTPIDTAPIRRRHEIGVCGKRADVDSRRDTALGIGGIGRKAEEANCSLQIAGAQCPNI